MSFGGAKIYFDGSHYIAIPKELQLSRKPKSKRQSKKQEILVMKSDNNGEVMTTAIVIDELFEELYKENKDKKQRNVIKEIVKDLKKYIENEEIIKEVIESNLSKKKRNFIERKKRLYRKIYLNKWSYFCTFTYDDKKHTEESFKEKLRNDLKHLVSRRDWKYIGVWERSPNNNRLHFHALVYAPTMPGEIEEIKDFSTKNHKMQKTYQNTHFLERFGRNDFKPINQHELSQAVRYLTKYMEKSGEKIVYSKGIATYFVSDIMEEDIVCTIGNEDKKLLLFDDFNCWDECVLIGKVSQEVIDQMPKAN